MKIINDVCDVRISDAATRHLQQVPWYIADKLYAWVERVKFLGLSEARKTKSYHDEPLKGKRAGQRSIRLNRSYRAIYEIHENNEIRFVAIKEVNKHDY